MPPTVNNRTITVLPRVIRLIGISRRQDCAWLNTHRDTLSRMLDLKEIHDAVRHLRQVANSPRNWENCEGSALPENPVGAVERMLPNSRNNRCSTDRHPAGLIVRWQVST
ncbi:hypothetical protein ETAA8_17560 [Anatilimnocola aggregata]|uniref:Uncharacterized protein n=1 Tax=Anatilimnocola aggregata TaxID=2528021 RepID=A0A517Y8X6_9BACT|nr:hypothetical protein ETAA8_17560 [Anatilimnocola aggregata]